MGLDTSWKTQAKCAGFLEREPGKPTPWQVAENDPAVDGVKSHQMIKYALLGCAGCPAQYDCARWAVQAQVRAATYSMRIGMMKWLQKQGDWESIIDEAEALEQPVQFAVEEIKTRRGD